MKIWYVSKYGDSPLSEGFMHGRFFSLCKTFVQNGHDATLIYSRSNGRISKKFKSLYHLSVQSGVKCIVLNGPLIKLGFNLKRIISWSIFEFFLFVYSIVISKKDRPDILIISSLSLLTFLTAIFLKRFYHCKLILEIRDIWPDTIVEMGKFSDKSWVVRFLRWVELLGYNDADGFISTLPAFDSYLGTRISKPFKFCCIPQGFDPELVCFEKNNMFDAFSSDYFTICYAGVLGKVNGIDLLLEVADKLKENRKIRFILLGDGVLKCHYQKLYKEYDNIVFLPSIPKDMVVSVISNANLLIILGKRMNIYQYGVSPNKWVDYMLSSRPILLSYSGHKGVIKDADCGFFVEAENADLLAEKIQELSYMSRSELDAKGKKGREYALKNLNFKVLGDKLLDFLKTI